MRTTFLNVEAATISLNVQRGARMVHAHGFFEGIKSKTLDINLEENPFPELAAIRTLITAYKLNYGLSRRLARYVIHYTNRTPFEQLVQIQFSHYGFARFDTQTSFTIGYPPFETRWEHNQLLESLPASRYRHSSGRSGIAEEQVHPRNVPSTAVTMARGWPDHKCFSNLGRTPAKLKNVRVA